MPREVTLPDIGGVQTGEKNYTRFRGVDYSTDESEIDDSRSPHMVNMIADEGGFPEKRVGWRTVKTLSGSIAGIFPFEGNAADGHTVLIVHAGSKIMRVELDESYGEVSTAELKDGINEGGRTAGFYMNGKLYLLTGERYLVYDGTDCADVSDNAYVPVTSYARAPAGGGTAYEQVNLLSRFRKNHFTADGASTVYQLDVTGLDADFTPEVTVNGAQTTAFTVDYEKGTITFSSAPAKGASEGVDNVKVKFAKTSESADMIRKCRITATYGVNSDNRVFVSGNPDHPNREWYSGLADPTYFPDRNYVLVGNDDFAIMCYLKSNGELLVVKEDNRQEGCVWNQTGALKSDGTAAFPIREGATGYGAVSRYAAASLLDDPLYLTPRGVYASTLTFAYNYMLRGLKCRSRRVNPKLNKEKDLENAVAACWRGWYVLVVGGCAYVADGNQDRQDDGYEWYYWTNIPAHVLAPHGQTLFFGTEDGRICKMNDDIVGEDNAPLMRAYNDDGDAIEAEWWTKLDTMRGSFTQLKTMPKRGSGVHLKNYARSGVNLTVRTESDHGVYVKTLYPVQFTFDEIYFDYFSFSTVDNSMIPFRYKKKGWKAIQIRLSEKEKNSAFGVHALKIVYYYNKYAKR